MFSPLLQGDLPRVLPSALHQTAALCASWRRVLGLFCAFLRYTLLSYPLPCGLSRILLPILCAWNILALAEGPGGPVRRPCGFTRTHLNNGRAGEDARPYENTGSCPVNAAGAGPRPARPGTKCGSGRAGEDTRPYEDTGSCPVNVVGAGPRPARRSRILFGIRRRGQAPALQKTDAQKSGRKPFKAGGPVCRPYGGERTGSVGSTTPGAGAGPQQRKFLQGQGPVARREFETPLRFCAPGLFCLTQGVTLVMGVRG